MFRMLGNKVELYRYKISYIEKNKEIVEYCISEEHKNEIEQMLIDILIEFNTTSINQTENEWIDGMVFETRDEAIKALEMGKSAWEEYNFNNNAELRNTSMLLDINYRLGLIEMVVKQ